MNGLNVILQLTQLECMAIPLYLLKFCLCYQLFFIWKDNAFNARIRVSQLHEYIVNVPVVHKVTVNLLARSICCSYLFVRVERWIHEYTIANNKHWLIRFLNMRQAIPLVIANEWDVFVLCLFVWFYWQFLFLFIIG